MIRLLAIVILVAGCAAPEHTRVASTEPPGVHSQELWAASDEIRRRDAELHRLNLETPAPDCGRITQLRDNICALAARICQIADMQPAGSKAAVNAGLECTDGKTRCKAAIESAAARGCPTKK